MSLGRLDPHVPPPLVRVEVLDGVAEHRPRHPGGTLLIVANSFLRYERPVGRVFRRVQTVAATRQYHVIAAADPR